MIRMESSGPFFFSSRNAAALSSLIKSGSVVRADILGPAAGGGTLVRVAGQTITASNISKYAPGDSLDVRVRFDGNTVFLHPVSAPSQNLSANSFTRLGVSETDVVSCLIAFFQKINARLEGRAINSLVRLASRFPGKERRAAEAAAILLERGIEPDFGTVEKFVSCIEGKAGYFSGEKPDAETQNSDRDFLAFINHKKGQDRHWIVIPFRKIFSGQTCSGSVRFLLDSITGKHIETCITFVESLHCWDFTIAGTECSFTADPPFRSVIFDRFVVYLKDILEKSEIFGISYYFPDNNPASVIRPVDLEI